MVDLLKNIILRHLQYLIDFLNHFDQLTNGYLFKQCMIKTMVKY